MIVTAHAAQRWCERVNPMLSPAEAISAIRAHEVVVGKAAAFRCSVVKLGTGTKLVLDGETVVTVLPREWKGRVRAGRAA